MADSIVRLEGRGATWRPPRVVRAGHGSDLRRYPARVMLPRTFAVRRMCDASGAPRRDAGAGFERPAGCTA